MGGYVSTVCAAVACISDQEEYRQEGCETERAESKEEVKEGQKVRQQQRHEDKEAKGRGKKWSCERRLK